MQNKNSLRYSQIVQSESTKFIPQFQRTKQYLFHNTASRFMVAIYTSIPIQNVCRYVDMLMESESIAIVRKDKCKITGELVEFLTTNPELFPKSNQLKLEI